MSKTLTVILCILAAVIAFSVAVVGLRSNTKPSQQFAIVDLSGVIKESQEDAIKTLTTNTDPVLRQKAMEAAKAFGNKINIAVAQLSEECKCIILLKETVVSGAVRDLTPELVAKLKGN